MAALCLVVLAPCDTDAAPGDMVLIDQGNGITEWTGASGDTISDVLKGAADTLGHELSLSPSITLDGRETVKIGDTTTSWRFYVWENGSWKDATSYLDPSAPYNGGSVALGFHPEGIAPVETPEYRSSWTMVRGDALSTGHQTADLDTSGDGSVEWSFTYGKANYVTSTILVEGKYAYVVAGGGYTTMMDKPTIYCYDRFTGETIWSFTYEIGAGYETATGAIVGDHIYIPATEGKLYRIPLTGPGAENSLVKSLDIPRAAGHTLIGLGYSTGPASLVYDSGMLYFGASDGYVYCVDQDLNIVWKSEIGGRGYYTSPTVYDGIVYYGALDGVLYAFDQVTGDLVDSVTVHTVEHRDKIYGVANTPVIVDGVLMLSFSDGRGMDSSEGGIAGYRMTDSGFVQVFKTMEPGLSGSYIVPVEDGSFKGIYSTGYRTMFRVSTTGAYEVMSEVKNTFKAPMVLVNGTDLYASTYDIPGKIFVFDLSGDITAKMDRPSDSDQFCMGAPVVIDGMIYNGTDGGAFAYKGTVPAASVPTGGPSFSIDIGLVILAVLIILLVVIVFMMFRRAREAGMPLVPFIRSKFKEASGFNNAGGSKVRRNKRRLVTVLIIGLILTFILFVMSLMYGPSGNYSFVDALSNFCSGLSATISGQGLTYDEIMVFDSRGCRAVAAVAVGVGLSISGSIYQAIIRNPMVDPYIMGVSAGAGVAAVSTIAFNFTFFGLLGDVTYATPIVAMVGGVIAFGCTMLLAEKAGGSSTNYVLAGVIIGLVFSAIQTLMLSMAGDKLNSAMSWLFGSFANIDWEEAIMVLIPSLAMSLVPLVWAKEFNLVLLGEEQARQMGLDVRRFNRWMLILASVLASVCVAFVGIIGFVGLVVPHLCRMILGGDHRLVMPASMVVGAALMLAADLFAKLIMNPLELPVGAITTVIGAPVFAYLLIKKGRMYDG